MRLHQNLTLWIMEYRGSGKTPDSVQVPRDPVTWFPWIYGKRKDLLPGASERFLVFQDADFGGVHCHWAPNRPRIHWSRHGLQAGPEPTWDDRWEHQPFSWIYPLVNQQLAIEHHHFIASSLIFKLGFSIAMQVDWRVGVVPIIGANKIGIHRPSIEIYESQQGQGGPSI